MNLIVLFFVCVITSTVVSMALMAGLFEFDRRNYEELNAKINVIKTALERSIDDGK